MTPEERAFLDALAADAADDVTRLVYADWLDERGDPRGAYLRAEHQLAALAEDDPHFAALDEEVRRRCRTLDGDWLFTAGRRWDVWLVSLRPELRIIVMKAVLEVVRDCGLAEAKALVETAPSAVATGCKRGQAEAVREHLERWQVFTSPRLPPPHVRVVLRPSKTGCAITPLRQPPPLFEIVLLGPRPGREPALLEWLGRRFGGDEDAARDVLANRLPYLLTRTEHEGRSWPQTRQRLEEFALIEVRRLEPPMTVWPPPAPQ
jgi:uncharacterized protein (TIGR02996 family)